MWETPLAPRLQPAVGVTFTCVGVAWTSGDWGLWLDFLDTADARRATPAAAGALTGGHLLPWQGVALPWNPHLSLSRTWGTAAPQLAEAVVATVATMLLAAQDNIAARGVERATPKDRRWLARHGQPSGEVTVVALRARQPRPAGTENRGGGAARAHRWLVSGHWRNQPYGPRNSLRRPTWIAPHLAGPEGTPFTDRVHPLSQPPPRSEPERPGPGDDRATAG